MNSTEKSIFTFKFLVRGKRQTRGNNPEASEKSGVPVFDYAYEANLVKGRIARNHLSVYPTLMGEDGEELNQDKNLFTHQNPNSFQDHNQLGILRDDSQLKYQSAYSRVINFFLSFKMKSSYFWNFLMNSNLKKHSKNIRISAPNFGIKSKIT